MLAVGLMSGTSLDGIDAALVEIRPRGIGYSIDLRAFSTTPYDRALRDELLQALPPNAGSIRTAAELHRALGLAYARAARAIAGSEPIDFIASHGQTVWHDGAAQVTLQLGDAFVIREIAGATVCYDFRSADCAVGGHGAPLVPRVDLLLLASDLEDRIALNLGGIANVTCLRKGCGADDVVAFDTGPANILIDAFVRERTGGERNMDERGALAAAGTVDAPLLAAMLGDEYFGASPPKTTGRERFGPQFLIRHRTALDRLSLEDGAATLTELTAASIADAVTRAGFAKARLFVSGGGAHNRSMLARISARLAGARVETSDAMGIPIDAKEAIAFVVLGYETLRARAGNVPSATGAASAVGLGAIAPYRLRELLARVAIECDVAA